MRDFETVPRGTKAELKRLRDLVDAHAVLTDLQFKRIERLRYELAQAQRKPPMPEATFEDLEIEVYAGPGDRLTVLSQYIDHDGTYVIDVEGE